MRGQKAPRILPESAGSRFFHRDSGLYIEGLPKERQPGVHVRRVNGVNLTDEQMRKYYKKIAAELGGRCVAQYQNAICLVFSENEIYEARGGALNWKKFWLMTEERPQRMEGFPLDAICADYRTGRHFYDGEATMPEEEGDGVRDFFRNALKLHEMRNKIENKIFQSRDLCLRALDTNSTCAKSVRRNERER